MELTQFVHDFADAMKRVDSKRLQAKSRGENRTYRPGIGPFAEATAVDLIIQEMQTAGPELYPDLRVRVPYPNSRQSCDLAVGKLPEWAVEVKMARMSGDNGKPDDTSIKDILSPYDSDRSALSDCTKLVNARFGERAAILIYGFDDRRRPLEPILQAFETLATLYVELGQRTESLLIDLVHPVFTSGRVCGWEVRSKN